MSSFATIITDVFDNRAEAPIASVDAERALITAAQAGDQEAQLQLVLAYAPALRNGVTYYTRALPSVPQADQLDDVRQQALLGLLEAIQAFRADTHDRLAAIAPGYIRDAVATAAGAAAATAVPERTLKRFFGILRAGGGKVSVAADLAPAHNMTRETFHAVLAAVRAESMEGHLDDDRGDFAGRGLEAHFSPIWQQEVVDLDDRIMAEVALRSVDGLEREVTELSYGFTDYEPVPDAEIGHRLGYTRPKIQRVRSSALATMRKSLGVA